MCVNLRWKMQAFSSAKRRKCCSGPDIFSYVCGNFILPSQRKLILNLASSCTMQRNFAAWIYRASLYSWQKFFWSFNNGLWRSWRHWYRLPSNRCSSWKVNTLQSVRIEWFGMSYWHQGWMRKTTETWNMELFTVVRKLYFGSILPATTYLCIAKISKDLFLRWVLLMWQVVGSLKGGWSVSSCTMKMYIIRFRLAIW